MTKRRTLVWFRGDLRIADNPALAAATANDSNDTQVIGVFLYCPAQWQKHDWGPRRVAWVHRHVEALRESLQALGIPLLVRVCPRFSEVPEVLQVLLQELECQRLHWNNEYEYNEASRDEAVEALCQTIDVTTARFDDQVLTQPGKVKSKTDSWYKVFTPFKNALIEKLSASGGPPSLAPTPEQGHQTPPDIVSDALPIALDGYELDESLTAGWVAGEAEGQRRLRTFVEEGLDQYHTQRDIPGVDGTSTLSPYLTVGAISTRQCVDAVLSQTGEPWVHIAPQKSGAGIWISELIWRDFYRHLLVGYPDLCKYKPFQEHTNAMVWRDDDEGYNAWTEGRTGIPIIDAGMRQLRETGWMHNRVRMVVAMFLTKQLLIDWRRGERWFMQELLDGDLASNNGGWQWAASTGTDAAPYFRVFNPWRQSARFDAEGDYIKRYIPELASVPPNALHSEAKLAKARPATYPAPICAHGPARKRAIDAFAALPK